MNLANKYRPSTWDDICEQSVVTQMLRNICESDNITNRNFLLIGAAGTGKAQPLYSKVLTPNGFITMGEIKVGDSVITRTGEIADVVGVYPQGKRAIYEITLQDRTKIRVADNHLNSVYIYNQRKKRREDFVLTTEELISFVNKSTYKVRIDVTDIDCWDDFDIVMDPYLVGALIGDGALAHNNSFTNSERDILDKVNSLLKPWNRELIYKSNYDYRISLIGKHAKYIYTYKSNTYSYAELIDILTSMGYPKFDSATLYKIANGEAVKYNKKYPELSDMISVEINHDFTTWKDKSPFLEALDSLGMLVKSIDKHIPKQYLYSSKSTRLSILQGLFDTDGYIDKQGIPTYTTCSKKLSDDFAFLVRSLGIRDTISSHPSKYKKDGTWIYTGSIAYNHHLKVPNGLKFYSSKKHSERYRDRQNPPIRNIENIKFIGYEECQCIMVNHPDHTYISDDFIPTHNTSTARVMAHSLNGENVEPIEVDGASNNGVDAIRELIQQASQFPIGCKWKVIVVDECHALTSNSWQALLKTLEENPAKTIWIFCTTNPEKIPNTILSRVQVFQLSKISLNGIIGRLSYILDNEISEGRDISYDKEAITYIAKMANGGMRDAITLTDKVLTFSNNITLQDVESALNLPNFDEYFKLLSAYAKKNSEEIVKIIDGAYNSGKNFVTWVESFQSFIVNILKYIFTHDIALTMIPPQYEEKLNRYNEAHANVCIKLANVLMEAIPRLKTTNYQQEVIYTCLCRTK